MKKRKKDLQHSDLVLNARDAEFLRITSTNAYITYTKNRKRLYFINYHVLKSFLLLYVNEKGI